MPIEVRIDSAQRVVFARAVGTLTDDDVFSYQRDVWSRPELSGFDELMDLAHVGTIEVPSADRVRQLAVLAAEMEVSVPPGRFAVVAPNDQAYGLARMYESWRELQGTKRKPIGIFRTASEALAFLGLPADFEPRLRP
ncbi:MAG TPA: hypothetical protein VEJ63_21095 [Planctomycetota bacterium]|nr:hypothetical protein [Planctomycetota bacterium]